jgi:hypothetical protein
LEIVWIWDRFPILNTGLTGSEIVPTATPKKREILGGVRSAGHYHRKRLKRRALSGFIYEMGLPFRTRPLDAGIGLVAAPPKKRGPGRPKKPLRTILTGLRIPKANGRPRKPRMKHEAVDKPRTLEELLDASFGDK